MQNVDTQRCMIVHPEIAVVEGEIARLRVSLSEAIRKLTYMQEVEGPHLRLLYVQQLGGAQVEVMELQADIAVFEVWWEEIQSAYACGDLEQLESIALALDVQSSNAGQAEGMDGFVVGGGSGGLSKESTVVERRNGVVVQGSLEVLAREKKRLRDCLQGYLDKRKDLHAQPPFSYAEQLRDPVLIAERLQEFSVQARGLEGRKFGLEEHLGDYLWGGSMELSEVSRM